MRVMDKVAFTAEWLATATQGEIWGDPAGSGVVTDSRQDVKNALFVALRGPNFDGHTFVAQALEQGATGVVVEDRWWKDHQGDFPAVVVKDSLQALQRMARRHRQDLRVPLVAITGSNGKTSTKEFVAAFLRPLGEVHKTRGNLNNHIGLPLTLLELNPGHAVSVVEMGMNHRGEIQILSGLAKPQIAIITNISEAHLEGVQDRRGVASAKAEILAGLSVNGVVVTPHGDPDLERALQGVPMKRITVGPEPQATYSWNEPRVTTEGTEVTLAGPGLPREGLTLRTRLLGFHCAQNLALAVAAARELNVDVEDIRDAAPGVPSVPGRLHLKHMGDLVLLDDTYNANPASLQSALQVLAALPAKRRIAVLGDMLELGPQAEDLHRNAVRGVVVDGLVTYGTLSRVMGEMIQVRDRRWIHAETHQEAAAAVLDWSTEDTVVLVKGSRGMKLENVLEAIGLGVGGDSHAV